ncbi:MAG: hypothetical protein LC708_00620 [Actinobacteria bacterium]|nr:hypothetical protein [Actinomycetota bacterium]
MTAPEELLPAAVAGPVATAAVPLEVFWGAPRLMLTPRSSPRSPVTDPVLEAAAVLSDWLPTALLPPVPEPAPPELLTPPTWEEI